jgi:hypothetical protein
LIFLALFFGAFTTISARIRAWRNTQKQQQEWRRVASQ